VISHSMYIFWVSIYVMLTRDSDPFLKMIEANKTYGFTIAVKELKETVPNIFRYASAYKRVNNLTSQGLWEMFVEPQPEEPKEVPPEDDPNFKHPLPEEILRGDPNHASIPEIDPEAMEGEKYNMCHFWSNFEIARLSWFRSKEYEDFFQMMDRSGGFNPFPSSRSTSRPQRYPLLPRLRLQTHDHPTLSRERASSPAAPTTIPRNDNLGREEAERRRRVLGLMGPREGERRGMQMQM